MTSVTIDPAIAALILSSVAILFASGAVHKLRDLRGFDEIFAAYGVLPMLARTRAARAVPALESLVAAGLIVVLAAGVGGAAGATFGLACDWAIGVGIVLLVGYAAAIGINLRRGRRDLACGCGGPDDRRPIAAWMVWRNVALAASLGVVLLPWSDRQMTLTDGVTIVFGAVACTLVYLCLDRLLGRTAQLTAQMRGSR